MKGKLFSLILLIAIAVGGGAVLYALKAKGKLRPEVGALLPPLPPQYEALVEMIPVPASLGGPGGAAPSSPAAPTAPAAPANPAAPATPNGPAAPAKYDLSVRSDGLSKAVATLSMENGTTMHIRFFSNDAPNTVKRVTQLIASGFYNGISFHRVEPGFVVQAGDPTGSGMGGSGVKLKAEFNARKHEPGILSMARTADPDSADSQFFIMLRTWAPLDHQYTVFGKVVDGYEKISNGIKKGDKIKSFTIQ